MKIGYREVFNNIKNKRINNLYLFYGEEEYVKEQALLQLTNAVVSPGLAALTIRCWMGTA